MRLSSESVSAGDWIVVTDANPDPIETTYLTLGGNPLPVFVDGQDVMVRCPPLQQGKYTISYSGYSLGEISVLGP